MPTLMESKDATTLDLIARARAGDREAFDLVAERLRERLAAFIATRLGARLERQVEIDDVLQEAYLRALRSLDRFEEGGEGGFFRWLCGIALHVIQESARRKERGVIVPLDFDAPGQGTAPEKRSERHERFDRLQEAMDGLAADHRKVIVLARIERLPIKEVALRMDRTPEAVTQLLWRALQNLRKRFGTTDSFGLPDRRLEDRGGAP
jgi:RNA polymerase sigma-70 factor (ECF subfamily)